MEATRWSGAEWATETRHIRLIGVGGIGSWTAFSLSRINHNLELIDEDVVDKTNVKGGQLYRTSDVGRYKTEAVRDIIRQFGCQNQISCYTENYNQEDFGFNEITICGLDNMKSRKEVFNVWKEGLKESVSHIKECLFIDGRLLLENMQIFTIKGDDEVAIKEYEEKHLFNDSEVPELDCTTKQCTFGAMIIAGLITATLCNWLTNVKMGIEMREVPFYQRFFLPLIDLKQDLKEKEEYVEN